MKEYNISEVAKMFGISSELLRNYERRGLIAPLRSEKGYRIYTKPDIYVLSGIRFLRNAGYSLEDIEKLYKATYEEALFIKGSRCEELQKEVAYLQLKLQAMRKDFEDFQGLACNADGIDWTTSPAMLRVNNQVNDFFLTDDKGILDWVEHMPIVRISPAFSREAILKGRDEVRFGYAVPLEFAQTLQLDNTPGAEIKEPAHCLTTIVRSHGKKYLSARMLENVLRFCDDQNLEITGDVWGITVGVYVKGGRDMRCHRLYIPVAAAGPGSAPYQE